MKFSIETKDFQLDGCGPQNDLLTDCDSRFSLSITTITFCKKEISYRKNDFTKFSIQVKKSSPNAAVIINSSSKR